LLQHANSLARRKITGVKIRNRFCVAPATVSSIALIIDRRHVTDSRHCLGLYFLLYNAVGLASFVTLNQNNILHCVPKKPDTHIMVNNFHKHIGQYQCNLTELFAQSSQCREAAKYVLIHCKCTSQCTAHKRVRSSAELEPLGSVGLRVLTHQ